MSENVQEQAAVVEVEMEKPAKKDFRKIVIKTALWTVGVVVLLLVGVFIFRDQIVETAVCKAGSHLTGTRVQLKNFSSSLSGEIRLQGFSVGNPQGFSGNNAIAFDEIFVHIDLLSLASNTIKIHQIFVDGMSVNLETNLSTTNLNTIQNNINKAVGGGSSADKPSAEEKSIEKAETAPDKEDNSQQVYIAKLETQNSNLSFTSSTINQTLSLPLPPVSLSDIGGKSIADTINELFGMMLSSVNKAAVNLGSAATAALSDAGVKLEDTLNQAGKALSENSGKIGKDLKKTGSELLKSLKLQFKNDK